jgi:hypothetical protein
MIKKDIQLIILFISIILVILFITWYYSTYYILPFDDMNGTVDVSDKRRLLLKLTSLPKNQLDLLEKNNIYSNIYPCDGRTECFTDMDLDGSKYNKLPQFLASLDKEVEYPIRAKSIASIDEIPNNPYWDKNQLKTIVHILNTDDYIRNYLEQIGLFTKIMDGDLVVKFHPVINFNMIDSLVMDTKIQEALNSISYNMVIDTMENNTVTTSVTLEKVNHKKHFSSPYLVKNSNNQINALIMPKVEPEKMLKTKFNITLVIVLNDIKFKLISWQIKP